MNYSETEIKDNLVAYYEPRLTNILAKALIYPDRGEVDKVLGWDEEGLEIIRKGREIGDELRGVYFTTMGSTSMLIPSLYIKGRDVIILFNGDLQLMNNAIVIVLHEVAHFLCGHCNEYNYDKSDKNKRDEKEAWLRVKKWLRGNEKLTAISLEMEQGNYPIPHKRFRFPVIFTRLGIHALGKRLSRLKH
ncbi:MAG TPA: hypothetical protein VM658_18040 [bacterium]|nr:hypothetical protein [bacterium]